MTIAHSSEIAVILAPKGRDAAVAAGLLGEIGIASTVVGSIDELVGQLAREVGFVLFTEESLRHADLGALRQWLHRQPEWSDLPFILLTAQGANLERNSGAARNLETLGNVSFLERPFHPTTLVSLARAALRARRRQYDARARLEAIRLGEQRLGMALVAGRLGSWTLDIPTLTLVASDQCKAHYGRGPDDPFGYDELIASIHPEDRPQALARMQRAFAGIDEYDVEYRCIWPGGQVRWVHVRGRVDAAGIPGADPARMSGMSLGITERKNAERDLRRSEERFRAAVDAVRGVVWTNSAEGKMLGEQPGWTKLTGQTIETYQGHGWASAIHPEDAQPTLDAWNRAVATRSAFNFEHRVRMANGAWGVFAVRAVPALEADGSIREWVGVHTDITRQRAIERQLAELAASLEQRIVLATKDLVASKNRLRSIFETSFQHVCELTPDGVLLDANATSLAGIGKQADEVTGQLFWNTPWFAPTPGAPELVYDMVARAAAGETLRQELTLDLAAGARIFDFSMRPVRGAGGAVIALVAEAVDLTDRRHAEAKLFQSQKLETIGQLTGGVAHDFNNLLTPIVGSLELLRGKLADDERAQRWAAAGLQSADRARVLVNRLLSFARRQALEARPVDVAELVIGMRDLIVRSIGPTVAIVVQTAPDLPPALVDPNELELAILNLCVNARDAMPDGGTITISVDADPDPVPFDGATAQDYLRIAVADTGWGMAPETVARAIEPFYTTKPIGKGTGLGLSMVHGLAGQLGGGLAIESAKGAGTTISIWLPMPGEMGEGRPVPAVPGFVAPSRSAKILLVDDEELVRISTAEILRDAGYDVIEAASGVAAKRLIADGLAPDALVTDQLMPGMKGSELASELVRAQPQLPVLIATGYSDLPDIPFPRISKPFGAAQLVDRVRRMVEPPTPS